MGFAFLMAVAPPGLAEDAAAEPERPWGFTIEPYLWVAGIGGKIGSDQTPSAAGVTFVDLLEHVKAGAMGVVSARYRRLGIFADGNYLRVDDNVPLRGGLITGITNADVTAKVAFGTASAFYRFRPRDGLTLDPYMGARWWFIKTDLDFKPKPAGTSVSPERAWADFVAGLKLNYDITDRWFVESALDVGGGASKVTWQVYGGTGYNFSESVAASIGWRYIGVDYDQDGFLFDTTVSGLLAGLKFRF
jgi:opacity protein-like surface antigen